MEAGVSRSCARLKRNEPDEETLMARSAAGRRAAPWLRDADIAEQLVEETAAGGRASGSCRRPGSMLATSLLAGGVDRSDIAGGIEADMDDVLVKDLWLAEGDGLGVAADRNTSRWHRTGR